MNPRYDATQPEHKVRKKTAAKLSFVIIVVLVLLAVMNPGKEDFGEYAVNHLEETLGVELAGGITSLVAQPMVESFTIRENYILFSTFSIPDIQDGKTFIGDIKAKRKYLGLFKIIFIKL
ncbi:hypothetical protein GC101_02440 [Paenibacillus sp. LMG 31459]|uniref:DUF4359 domain-containing protein n=1 Tax=Paenibacillus phytohabitans TaxID=2654978 RepID=A0ABX1Y9Y6_9BACL|nr:hypothetical protein [Paenibacillus phytohabitans]NOU77730.1 hypothetical protein [Paenibacillus phytohabitans]